MRELSLHILDLAENGIMAGADRITIHVDETFLGTHIKITVTDNGRGMAPAMAETVSDPFVTTRTTRRVGMGIALFKAAAERCNGNFDIQSVPKKGTAIWATFEANHIDRAPVGNMGETITTLIAGFPDISIHYDHILFRDSFNLDTAELKQDLDGIELNNPHVLSRIKEIINNFFQGKE
ncbi:MAG: sensor histidine kinase [Desulfobacteraceae bacterium]|nr:sensor histidine kinase [Desulfobacteraceae bacterium]